MQVPVGQVRSQRPTYLNQDGEIRPQASESVSGTTSLADSN